MKYKLTDETMTTESGILLHRIECVCSFGNVKAGDKGGWIEKEKNLSQYGDAWVYGDARVYGDAWVSDNACVYENAWVYGEAWVSGDAWVFGKSRVYDNAWVYGKARVYGKAWVYGEARLCGEARVSGDAWVSGYAWVYGEARLCGEARVSGNARVYGDARVYGNAIIVNSNDYIVFKNNWSSGRYFTWTRSNDMWKVGCFYGTGEQLIEKAYKDSKLSGDCYKAYVELVDKLKETQK